MIYTDLNTEIDVGSSGHLIEFGPFRALVDCGLHPKYMGLSALPNLSKVPPETLDFIAVTHTHLDHCGSLPVVARHQSSAHILVADESYELLFRMLRNSRTVMAKQREEFNIKEYPLERFRKRGYGLRTPTASVSVPQPKKVDNFGGLMYNLCYTKKQYLL